MQQTKKKVYCPNTILCADIFAFAACDSVHLTGGIYYDYLVQAILVDHSTRIACVSYDLDHFPYKISKAIFICVTLVSDGQRPFDVFAEEVHYTGLVHREIYYLVIKLVI